MDLGKRLNFLQIYVNDSTVDEDLLLLLLEIAGNKLLNILYPYGTTQEDVPERYHMLQVEVAHYLFAKRGAEGQTSHNEGGISRNYEDADIPKSMLRGLSPFVGRIE